jgi:4-hydroxy-tetrahydrodipicolinate synthase
MNRRRSLQLRGCIADLPTPFDADGAPDLAALRRLCASQTKAGATALIVAETAGEAWALTTEERRAVIRAAVEAAGGAALVIAGSGSNDTAEAATLAADAEQAGADAVLSMVPYYNKPTQRGLVAHLRLVAAATDLPLLLHDCPDRSVVLLQDDALAELAALPGVAGLRLSPASLGRLRGLRRRFGERLLLLADGGAQELIGLIGADATVSAGAAIAPALWQAAAARAADMLRCAPLLEQLDAALAQEPGPGAVKLALALRGEAAPHVRLPMVPPSADAAAAIAAAVACLAEGEGGARRVLRPLRTG